MAMEDSLWREPEFLKLWTGQTIAQLASQMSFLAVPLVAAVTLEATPLQMGVLTALSSIPTLLFGLQAGVLADRHRRRPIMVGADLMRALVLAMIPLAWWLDLLSIPLLGLLMVLAGLASMMFDVAYQALLPSVVSRNRLVEANSQMELSRTASELIGPGVGGALLQALGAPLMLLANGGLHGLSAAVIWKMNTRESLQGKEPEKRASFRRQIAEGLEVVWQTPLLRTMIGARGLLGFFNATLEAVFVLYIVRVLGVDPVALGIVFGIGGAGFLVGAMLPARSNQRLGLGVTTTLGAVTIAVSDLLVPLAEGTGWLVLPLLALAQFFFGLGMTVFNVNGASVRQLTVSPTMQGRASSISSFLAVSAVPAGALLGGLLGEVIGLREPLLLAAGGELAAALWLWWSPLRQVRSLVDTGEPPPHLTA
jgi:predicted MFS family arabinose efflux permease